MSDKTPDSTTSTRVTPPTGWFHFGTHDGSPESIEFSKDLDDSGDPMWERPVAHRNTLLRLATMLDEARIAANVLDATAHEPGVYGHIKQALKDTLALILGGQADADATYRLLIVDGYSVERAVEKMAGRS